MPSPPLTYLEKKWASGFTSNRLIEGATQTNDRKRLPMLDRDIHRNITPMGRRTLMTLGNWLYWNVSAVRGAVNEMAELAARNYIAQFEGEDQAWGTQVENWLYEHDKICDVRGWPFNMATYRMNLVRETIVKGGMGTLLTQNDQGYPMIQVIPAHRIGSNPYMAADSTVQGGPWDGARIIDGVILNDQGRPLAYRVMGENQTTNEYRDIPAKDMFLSFMPEAPEQVREISLLGASVFDWKDLKESRSFELLTQKLAASIGMTEHNEAGEADKTKKLINRTSDNYNTPTAGSETPIATTATETIDGISVHYFRAGSNSKLEAFQSDRPSANQQNFRDDVIREALCGMGWSFDFSYNPTKAGGAQMRIVIDKINRKLDCLRDDLVKPAQTRIDGYRVAKVMDNPARTDKKTVFFPFNVDWWRWSYQGPAELTADEKYSSDVDLQERRTGRKTLAKSAAQRGDYWKDIRSQRKLEADALFKDAEELATRYGVPIEVALARLEDTSSTSSLTTSVQPGLEQQQQTAPDPSAP